MQRIFMLLFALCISAQAFSQNRNSNSFKTIIGPDTHVSASGSFFMEFSPFQSDLLVMTGGQGALSINGVYIGGYGQGASTRNRLAPENRPSGFDNYRLRFGHGGFLLGSEILGKRAIHIDVNSKFGWGNASWKDGDYEAYSDQVFVVTPTVGIELNVANFFRIALTGGYRATLGLELPNLDENELSTFVGQLSFKFGWFNTDY